MPKRSILSSGTDWIAGDPQTYDRTKAIDTAQLFAFLLATQPEETRKIGIADYRDRQNMARLKFLGRLSGEIAKRGVIDVLRHGIKHGALSFDLFYGIRRRRRCLLRTASASHASLATATTKRNGRLIFASSSMVFPSPLLS